MLLSRNAVPELRITLRQPRDLIGLSTAVRTASSSSTTAISEMSASTLVRFLGRRPLPLSRRRNCSRGTERRELGDPWCEVGSQVFGDSSHAFNTNLLMPFFQSRYSLVQAWMASPQIHLVHSTHHGGYVFGLSSPLCPAPLKPSQRAALSCLAGQPTGDAKRRSRYLREPPEREGKP
jgi:hypothetical protein